MEYDKLKNVISRITSLPASLWEVLRSHIHFKRYLKGELLHVDTPDSGIAAFIVCGGAITLASTGRDKVVLRLWKAKDIILYGVSEQLLPIIHTEIFFTLESTVMEIQYEQLALLAQSHAEIWQFLHTLFLQEQDFWHRQNLWHKTKTAEERHLESIEHYGTLYLQLTDKLKASYLGVTERWVRNLK